MPDNVRSTLQKALTKLMAEKAHIDRNIAALQTALGALAGGRDGTRSRGRRRRRMSADARKAIGRRMKAYWAKRRATSVKGATSRRHP
jgi:hypothetical protein